MNRPPKLCIFCGQPGNMSDEHVFPDRLKRILPRVHGRRQYGSVDHTRKRGKVVREDSKVKNHQGSIGTSRVRWVCKPCNEGWLNDMEQDSFPVVEQLISGEKLSLSKDDQLKLSRLAISIAMTGEWLSTAHVSTTQGEREEFRKTRLPPRGWYVFVGRNVSKLVTPFRHSDGSRLVSKSGDGPRRYASHTMEMGVVFLHVICLSPEDFFGVDQYAKILNLVPIYPTTEFIPFVVMPGLDTAGVAHVSSYARISFQALED